MKLEQHKIKDLEIWLRTIEWDNRTKFQNEGNGIYIADIMHVFKTNNPASQSERGQ